MRTLPLGEGDQPDSYARAMVELTDPAGALLHSTSWRFADGHVVLTYVALPDPEPGLAPTISADASLAGSDDPLEPTPTHIVAEAVAAHACRHLAFLRKTDALIARQAQRLPQLWRLIDAFQPGMAGLMSSSSATKSSPAVARGAATNARTTGDKSVAAP